MAPRSNYLAIDPGAESGRAILGEFDSSKEAIHDDEY